MTGACFTPNGRKVALNSAQGRETLTWLHGFTERVLGGINAVNEFYQANRSSGSAGWAR